jgi:hypothetical protein
MKASVTKPMVSRRPEYCQCWSLNNAPIITTEAPHPYTYPIKVFQRFVLKISPIFIVCGKKI